MPSTARRRHHPRHHRPGGVLPALRQRVAAPQRRGGVEFEKIHRGMMETSMFTGIYSDFMGINVVYGIYDETYDGNYSSI